MKPRVSNDVSDPAAQHRLIVEFLEMARPDRQFVLAAIRVEGSAPKVRTFDDAPEAATWAVTMNANKAHNLYWIPNRLRSRMERKPGEVDVAEVLFAHVDIDPRAPEPSMSDDQKGAWNEAEREQILSNLHASSSRPTIVIASGGGYQAFWRLDTPFPVEGEPGRTAEMKAYNTGLRDSFNNADSCQSLDHLMRLPGTVNWPDAKKRKKGRTPRLAEVVWSDGPTHALFDLPVATTEPTHAAERAPAVEHGEVCRLTNIDELANWGIFDGDRLRVLITKGCIAEGYDGDRSSAVFDLCCNLHRRGVPAPLIVGIISDETWAISAHVVEKRGRNVLKYAWRQVEQAIAEVAADGEALDVDAHGRPYPSQHNIRFALRKMGVRVRYDRFADRATMIGLEGFGPNLSDAAMTRLRLRMDEEHKLKVGKEFFCDVVEDAARRDSFHPVADYLDELTWDGTPRLDSWMSTYLQAEDTDYTRAVGALMFIAAVRRVRQPGCKFDEMVVLESEQGKSKSSALAILAVEDDWFSDDLPLSAEAKQVIERTQGRWIIEAGELSGMGKKGVEHLKAFLARRRDSSRMAYGRLTHDAPRHFIVVGTTNDERYLIDNTGNRRFWPVRVGDIDLDALRRDRDQLWAEAAAREAAGATIRLDRSLWQAAAVEQEDRRLVDPLVPVLTEVLGRLNGKVRSKDVWDVIGIPVGQRTPDLERRVGLALRELGFERKQRRFGGDPEYAYVRGNEDERRRRILVVWVPGDSSIGSAWQAILEGERAAPQKALGFEHDGGASPPF